MQLIAVLDQQDDDMIWSEKRTYIPYEVKKRRHEKRKGTQKANKRTGYDDQSWSDWRNTGYGGSSASSSRTWRPR